MKQPSLYHTQNIGSRRKLCDTLTAQPHKSDRKSETQKDEGMNADNDPSDLPPRLQWPLIGWHRRNMDSSAYNPGMGSTQNRT